MKSSVIVFPGSNCDRDVAVALEKLQFKNSMIWHKETELPKSDLIVVPGGFSYGDYLRSGAIAAKSNILSEVISAGKKGSLILLHGRLPHYSCENKSEKSRHAYTLHIIDGNADYPKENWLQRPNLPLKGFI